MEPTPSRHRESAFTLIELLVVVGIIAILVAILMPALTKARQSAVRTVCALQLKQFANAFQMYVNDNRGWLPTCTGWVSGGLGNDYVTVSDADGDGWWTPLPSDPNRRRMNFSLPDLWNKHYLDSRKIAICPAFDSSLWSDYWYGWTRSDAYLSATLPGSRGGIMTYLYLPWVNVNSSLINKTWSGIYGQGGISMRSRWFSYANFTTSQVAILQDTCSTGSPFVPGNPPHTNHGNDVKPEGSNILKGDWSVEWVPFSFTRFAGGGPASDGYYNYIDGTD